MFQIHAPPPSEGYANKSSVIHLVKGRYEPPSDSQMQNIILQLK